MSDSAHLPTHPCPPSGSALPPSVHLDDHPLFRSVGLVCRCGRACATMEGVATRCAKCGAVYIVTVMVLDAGAPPSAIPHAA